ncbi:MAG: hypothetical protein BMS9Abin23_0953 [Thermodesulfobacteriota bacterium]|nr:MAG: hypothetical protein BMS9Abin23_0953 [Thermodesulfobacteriota bacterium]
MALKPEINLAQKKIINGLYVISTKLGNKVNAMTAAWVSRVSFKPPLVMVAVGKTRFSHHMIKESGVFAINVLGPDNIDMVKHFGFKSGATTDKFAGIDYNTKVTGAPILTDCIAWLDCKVSGCHDAGDHTLFVGEILDGGIVREGETMVYKREEIFG